MIINEELKKLNFLHEKVKLYNTLVYLWKQFIIREPMSLSDSVSFQ